MITKNNKNKKPRQRTFFPAIMGLLIIVILAFLTVSNWKINQRRNERNSRIEYLGKELQALEEKNNQLKAAISQTQGQEYAEEVLREELNYKKPGEEVVVVKSASTTTTEEKPVEIKNFWQKVLEKLGF